MEGTYGGGGKSTYDDAIRQAKVGQLERAVSITRGQTNLIIPSRI